MPQHDFFASIHADSERYADWASVFDDPHHVPITTPYPERVQLPIGVRPALFVKVTQLGPDEVSRMVRHLSERFSVSPEAVRDELAADPDHAVPLLAEDVTISILHIGHVACRETAR